MSTPRRYEAVDAYMQAHDIKSVSVRERLVVFIQGNAFSKADSILLGFLFWILGSGAFALMIDDTIATAWPHAFGPCMDFSSLFFVAEFALSLFVLNKLLVPLCNAPVAYRVGAGKGLDLVHSSDLRRALKKAARSQAREAAFHRDLLREAGALPPADEGALSLVAPPEVLR